jgi:uncharacterized membrane protein YkvA (DUF1232 family)
MLIAFREHLKELANDDKDPFHVKIRARVGKRATKLLEKRLRQLIVITPDVVDRVHLLWRQFPKDAPAKKVGGYLLSYLYHPKDFLDEGKHGLFGYLDDAYFAALVYEFVLKAVQEGAGVKLTPKDNRFLCEVVNMKAAAKLVIPDEAKKIDEMFLEIQSEKESGIYSSAFAT